MKVSSKGIDLIKSFEGLAKVGKDGLVYPYLDAVRVPTIGYGNTFYDNGKKVSMSDKPITKAEAERLLAVMVEKFADKIKPNIVNKLSDNAFSALVSLAYNIGVDAFKRSTLLKKVNLNAANVEIEREFLRWDRAGGRVLAGLTRRRKAEYQLFIS